MGALVDQAGLPSYGRVMLIAGGLVINVAVTATMYRFLTSAEPTFRMVLAGALFSGVLYTVLHFVGTALTRRMLQSAETYGNFAGVLALLSWISLHALTNLFGAEINAAIHRRGLRGGVVPDAPPAAEASLAEA